MKKAILVLLTIVLCTGTIYSFTAGHREEKIDSNLIRRAESLDDIKAALKKAGIYEQGRSGAGFGKLSVGSAAIDMDSASDLAVPEEKGVLNGAEFDVQKDEFNSSINSGDFSETNIQIEGIDEADIVKTDGDYLYVAADTKIFIVSAKNGVMKVVSEIDVSEADAEKSKKRKDAEESDKEYRIKSIFIDDGRLAVFGSCYIWDVPALLMPSTSGAAVYNMPESRIVSQDAAYFRSGRQYTYVNIYDTKDKTKPELLQEFSISGDFQTARKAGEYIYLAASEYLYGVDDLEKAGSKEILPLYSDVKRGEDDAELTAIDPGSVYLCPIESSPSFTTLAVLNIAGDQDAQIKSYIGSANEFYMSSDSIFMTFWDYEYDEAVQSGREYTDIIALAVDGMEISYRADGRVPGALLNQFSMDEYNGYFRIATTEWESGSNLFVLDENLDITGSIRGIAEGEQIYSVRFMGDKGYLVTFETMDPFFTIDLSDPYSPVLAGELKLPGYSNYLYLIDENTVLGIGRQTKELFTRDEFGKEEAAGYREGGIKLSLFDISDFSNPKELDSYVIGNEDIWSDALYDHKAIFIDRERNLVGFCIENYAENKTIPAGAYIFEISGDEIMLSGSLEKKENAVPYNFNSDGSILSSPSFSFNRICYIGKTYYYLQEGIIRSFDRNSMNEIAEIELN